MASTSLLGSCEASCGTTQTSLRRCGRDWSSTRAKQRRMLLLQLHIQTTQKRSGCVCLIFTALPSSQKGTNTPTITTTTAQTHFFTSICPPPPLQTQLTHALRLGLCARVSVCLCVMLQLCDCLASITATRLRAFISAAVIKFLACVVEAGTACGAIGAQSIGEPGTQVSRRNV